MAQRVKSGRLSLGTGTHAKVEGESQPKKFFSHLNACAVAYAPPPRATQLE